MHERQRRYWSRSGYSKSTLTFISNMPGLFGHTDRVFLSHNRHTGKAVERLFPRFRLISKVGMGRRLRQIKGFDIAGDRSTGRHRQGVRRA